MSSIYIFAGDRIIFTWRYILLDCLTVASNLITSSYSNSHPVFLFHPIHFSILLPPLLHSFSSFSTSSSSPSLPPFLPYLLLHPLLQSDVASLTNEEIDYEANSKSAGGMSMISANSDDIVLDVYK